MLSFLPSFLPQFSFPTSNDNEVLYIGSRLDPGTSGRRLHVSLMVRGRFVVVSLKDTGFTEHKDITVLDFLTSLEATLLK